MGHELKGVAMSSLVRPLVSSLRRSLKGRGLDALNALIAQIFSAGEQGAIYIPRPIVLGTQSLFQDAAGTVPVIADGDPVGLMIDQSPNSNNAPRSVSAERPLYNLENGIHSLNGDGVNDKIASQNAAPWLTGSTANAFFAIAFKPNSTVAGYAVHCDGDDSSQANFSFAILSNIATFHRVVIGGEPFNFSGSLDTVIVYCQFNKSTRAGVISWNGGAEENITVGGASTLIDPLRLFSRETGAAFDGKIYGVIGAEGPVSFDNRRNVMNYLAGLAGVTL